MAKRSGRGLRMAPRFAVIPGRTPVDRRRAICLKGGIGRGSMGPAVVGLLLDRESKMAVRRFQNDVIRCPGGVPVSVFMGKVCLCASLSCLLVLGCARQFERAASVNPASLAALDDDPNALGPVEWGPSGPSEDAKKWAKQPYRCPPELAEAVRRDWGTEPFAVWRTGGGSRRFYDVRFLSEDGGGVRWASYLKRNGEYLCVEKGLPLVALNEVLSEWWFSRDDFRDPWKIGFLIRRIDTLDGGVLGVIAMIGYGSPNRYLPGTEKNEAVLRELATDPICVLDGDNWTITANTFPLDGSVNHAEITGHLLPVNALEVLRIKLTQIKPPGTFTVRPHLPEPIVDHGIGTVKAVDDSVEPVKSELIRELRKANLGSARLPGQ
jgi:hypothetical protein